MITGGERKVLAFLDSHVGIPDTRELAVGLDIPESQVESVRLVLSGLSAKRLVARSNTGRYRITKSGQDVLRSDP